MQVPGGGNRLHLESPEQPVPVKKQGKYNITRWAVTGRDDLGINTACWRLYEALKADPKVCDDDWRELCFLWGSDFIEENFTATSNGRSRLGADAVGGTADDNIVKDGEDSAFLFFWDVTLTF